MLKSEMSIFSSFYGYAWLCQKRMDQSSSVSTSKKLRFFDTILTYLWRQKNQEMYSKKWNIGNGTPN